MANIQPEINDFLRAVYGEEVRESMVSLANKLNNEVENNTQNAAQAATNANTAAANATNSGNAAQIAKDAANTAATNANNAAANAETTRQNIADRLAAGEFKGERGEAGERGAQGESGVTAPASGMFSLYLDPATGNLYADYPDGSTPPAFEYDPASGNLYFVTG